MKDLQLRIVDPESPAQKAFPMIELFQEDGNHIKFFWIETEHPNKPDARFINKCLQRVNDGINIPCLVGLGQDAGFDLYLISSRPVPDKELAQLRSLYTTKIR